MIDQIRASKLPSNMMQFAARGALSVPPAENIEILVHLARHNPVFGSVARMTLAGWDEKASLAAAADPATTSEVLSYLISPDNMRPVLLPALLANPSLSEYEIAKFAMSASQESIAKMLQSPRIRSSERVLEVLKSNPYLKKEQSNEIQALLGNASNAAAMAATDVAQNVDAKNETIHPEEPSALVTNVRESLPDANKTNIDKDHPQLEDETSSEEIVGDVPDETVSSYLAEHAAEIAAEPEKPFQAIGGIADLLGEDYFPVSQIVDVAEMEAESNAADKARAVASAEANTLARKPPGPAVAKKKPVAILPKRQNALQKISVLDVKGRIQLALKGNKEERALLIRDGTKIVALAVLDAPKLSDGEVEKFASQKNILEAVLRHIPLKRRFMKNYIVVRNLVANPRTPLDLGLGLMKNLLLQDLKNLSTNKEISETIRKLALKSYKQKLQTTNQK